VAGARSKNARPETSDGRVLHHYAIHFDSPPLSVQLVLILQVTRESQRVPPTRASYGYTLRPARLSPALESLDKQFSIFDDIPRFDC
jgi:hypothetical protein